MAICMLDPTAISRLMSPVPDGHRIADVCSATLPMIGMMMMPMKSSGKTEIRPRPFDSGHHDLARHRYGQGRKPRMMTGLAKAPSGSSCNRSGLFPETCFDA